MEVLVNRYVGLAIGAAMLGIVGCTVEVQPGPPVADEPVVINDPVPPPPVVTEFYFSGGHYYYWHPDRHAYVVYNGRPAEEHVVRVDRLPHRR
jgi:hypothetical protein